MKIYLLLDNQEHADPMDSIRGVFASLELAQAAYPGEWIERDADWYSKYEADGVKPSAHIYEYDVQEAVNA